MTIWKPIKLYESDSFTPHEVWVRAEGHEQPVKASFGWDEEYWDGWSDAWHKETNVCESLGFIPEEWCELHEYEE